MNPTEIARQTMKTLAAERLPPTPEEYARVYRRLAGETPLEPVHEMIQSMAGALGRGVSAERDVQMLTNAVEHADWEAASTSVKKLVDRAQEEKTIDWGDLCRDLLREWDVNRDGTTKAKKREALEHILSASAMDTVKLVQRLRGLIQAWSGQGQLPDNELKSEDAASAPADFSNNHPSTHPTDYSSDRSISTIDPSPALRRLWQLLMENLADLVEDDSWVRGQIHRMRELLDNDLTALVLEDAERSFKALVLRQSGAKKTLNEAKFALKEMVGVLVSRLGTAVENTDMYSGQLEGYAVQVEEAENLSDLSEVVQRMLGDTQTLQLGLTRTRDELREARANVEHHQQQVDRLQSELAQVSASVRIDDLTQTLNRRGLDEAFQTEIARSQRTNTPLCVALLDLDNFKQLNDRLGHHAGDEVLRFLVSSLKAGLRPTDVMARWGGEEFVLLLPQTDIEEAVQVMTRLQRALTSQLFMYHQEHIFVTFSAGVTLWGAQESQESVIGRADNAMFEAKKSGKNRVCSA